MGFWENDDSYAAAHDQVVNAPHKAELSHELIAGAAAYEAAKSYEKHERQNGKPARHAEAKELIAGFIGAFVDREVESKGLDYIDRDEAKRAARLKAEAELANRYY